MCAGAGFQFGTEHAAEALWEIGSDEVLADILQMSSERKGPAVDLLLDDGLAILCYRRQAERRLRKARVFKFV